MSSFPRRFADRAGITLVLLLAAGSAFSADRDLVATDVPQCRGVVSQEILDAVLTAKKDPRRALEKKRRRGATRMSPASIDCASRLWLALHPPRPARSIPISAADRRMSSREGLGEENAAIPALPYAGAHVDDRPVQAVRTPPLRRIRPIPPPRSRADHRRKLRRIPPDPPTEVGGPDGPRQEFMGPVISAPTPAGVGFDGVGVGLGDFVPSSNPPDTNGRVGATQYVQWNNTSFAVFSKTGTLLYGPAAGNTLFQSLGGPCATHNDGDPVVSYDILAGRWVLSQFVVGASPDYSHQCFAISVTDDATGSYYLYDFVTDPVNFVDYPKTGVWPDGYYMTSHVFTPAGAYTAGRVHVFERDKMIAGLPARQVQADLGKIQGQTLYGFVPADLDSLTPPPAGAAGFVMGPHPGFTNRTVSTRVAVTWGTTPTINLTTATIGTVGIVSPACVNNTAAQDNRDCVPQPPPAAPADYVDNIAFHYMYRLAYRNFGGGPAQESLVVSAPTAGSASTPGHGAIKWIEFRNAGGLTTAPTLYQSGTFDPDTAYRWLPSIAMDKDHNIAVGYSKSSTSIKPGVFMTGRLGTDTLNTMGAETTVQAGIGSQLGGGNRWGDYSSMTLDPIDQCTFWYTNQYMKTDGSFNWSTRIATYRFPSCTSAAAWGTVSGTITSCATGVPLSGVVVTLSNGYAGATDASGHYSIVVPAGTYDATVAGTDRNCTTASPETVSVIATSGGTTTQNFCMVGASNLETDGAIIDDTPSGNDNDVVNRNECVSLNIPLENNGCANETAISATLTTSTPNVTITQGSSAYPNLAIDASALNTTPFQFQTSNAFACGTLINFNLTVNYASGSKVLGISIPTCDGGPDQIIPSSSLTAADLTQSDRLGRDGVPSTCEGKTSPGGGFPGTKYYKTFNFTNNSAVARCYTVDLTAALGGAGDIQSAAYSPTYNPAALSTNYLGDSGIVGLGTTEGSASYSFMVPASANFVVVVNTSGTTTSSVFSGTVSGFVDTTAGPGPCVACTTPPTPSASNTGPYCTGGTISLSTPTVSGATYSWTGPNGFTSSLQNPTRSNATLADAGTYSVTITVDGCTSAAGTTDVVVNATPATPTASNGGPYCEGATISLSTPLVASATYSWTGPNGFTSSIRTPTIINATTANAGSYSVTVTVNGCTSAAGSTTVIVNATPATPTIGAGGPTTFCAGGSVTLTSSSASGNQWYRDGNPIGGATNQGFSVTTSGSYTVVVTANGCPSAPSSPIVVTVNPIPPTPTISAGGPTTFCEGGSVTLTSSSASGNQWYRNGVLLGGETLQTLVASTAGNYTVQVTASGCTSAVSAPATVTILPKPDATITVASTMFSGAAGPASVAVSCAGATFSWSIAGGTITAGNGTPNITFTAGAAGTLTLEVTVTNSAGCSDTKSANVTVQTAAFGAPPFFRATAAGTTSANLMWAAVQTADHYEIHRSTDTVNWTLRGTSGTTAFSDSGLTSSTTYFYKVRTIKADLTASAFSAVDPATTVVFTDASLTVCPAVIIKAAHVTELRSAVNTARAAAGLTAFTFTDPALASGNVIKAVHITDLRAALAPVLSAISVTPSYTDPTITPGVTTAKAAHIRELRDLVQ